MWGLPERRLAHMPTRFDSRGKELLAVTSDPAMYAADRKARKQRAEYVRAAVDGRNVKSGEETTIPIPRSDDGVAALLSTLADDHETVAETSIEELEAEIDEAVYDLFELTPEEREIVEEYLEVF